MTETILTETRFLEEALGRRLEGPEWLRALRRRAFEIYKETPLPDRVAHLWRYTDPKLFVPPAEAVAREPAQTEPAIPEPLARAFEAGDLSGFAVRDARGGLVVRLAEDAAAAGVRILDLRAAAVEAGPLVEANLGKLVPAEHGKFEALNLALWRGGVFVHVPRNVVLERPLHLWLEAPPVEERLFAPTRLLVIAEEGASLTLLDEVAGGGATDVNSVVELAAGDAARIRYALIQRFSERASFFTTARSAVGRDADILTLVAALGALRSKADLGTVIQGRGAHVELLGFLFGVRKQHFDHHTVHDHRAPNTTSNLDFKVVLKDRARSAYTGLIRIEPDAPNCEAYQENRNLLLTDGARADSIPELEILTDEVVCTHGATVGSLDPLHIFYLMSRGLDRREAVRMIVGGFIEPTLARLPPDLSARLRLYVEKELEDL